MAQSVVFIASLSHSGSTVLDLFMGGHSRFIGLGEIVRVLQPGPEGLEKTSHKLCSCNAGMDKCIFWGKVASELRNNANLDTEARYQTVLDIFEDVFGRDRIPVDSSKYIGPLRAVRDNPRVADIRVLFIIKDVRAYTISQLENAKKQGRPLKEKIPAYHFLSWYFRNRRVLNFLNKEGIPYTQIGYDELCLRPNPMAQKICDFLGEKLEPSMLSLKDSHSHVIRGNRIHSQPNKRQAISYDHRWFYRREWLGPALLFPHIMRFNAREVYNNGALKITTGGTTGAAL
jgi:hypothetical protein